MPIRVIASLLPVHGDVPRRPGRRWAERYLLAAAACLALAGCASYRPLPLPARAGLARDLASLRADATSLALPAPRARPLVLEDGLSPWETATLAVANNPGLEAARTGRGVSEAQLYAAGLWPDPRLSAGLDHPTGHTSGTLNGFNLGLSYDLVALITHAASRQAVHAQRRQVDLDLLWQEWQVVQQARTLHVQAVLEGRRLALLEAAQGLYAERYASAGRLLRRGDLTLEGAGVELTALLDTASRRDRLRLEHGQTLFDLHALLGLAPGVPLPLADLPAAAPFSASQARQDLADLAWRRPDLLALQAGYASQEARVRAAILAQFPAVSIGLSRARDTDEVRTIGLGIDLQLPLFTGNRGAIATQRATRAQLRAEYRVRLTQAEMDVARLLERQALLRERRRRLAERLPELERLVEAARVVYRRGDMQALPFLRLELGLIDRRLEALRVEQTLWELRIGLETLLAEPA